MMEPTGKNTWYIGVATALASERGVSRMFYVITAGNATGFE